MGPEDNPADDVQPTKEEWEEWEKSQPIPPARKIVTLRIGANAHRIQEMFYRIAAGDTLVAVEPCGVHGLNLVFERGG